MHSSVTGQVNCKLIPASPSKELCVCQELCSQYEINTKTTSVEGFKLQNGKKITERQTKTTCYSNLPLLIENFHQNWLIYMPKWLSTACFGEKRDNFSSTAAWIVCPCSYMNQFQCEFCKNIVYLLSMVLALDRSPLLHVSGFTTGIFHRDIYTLLLCDNPKVTLRP